VIYAATHGYLDKLPVNKLKAFEDQFFSFLNSKYPTVLKGIAEKQKIDDDIKSHLEKAFKEFEGEFSA
jgi:F-type H+-transporting ATPase subunit alpha